MPASSASGSSGSQVCYFTITPHRSTYPTADSDFSGHYSVETPSPEPIFNVLSPETPAEPSNPLLAARPPPFNVNISLPTMDASKLLQLQTSAAYSSKRPQPQPIQDVLDLSPISDSRSGSDASSHGSFAPALQTIRCSRCHRTASIGSKQMVSFGVNSYYCTRCASIVGFGSG